MGGQDRTLASIADRQHGVVGHLQALVSGVSVRSLEKRLDKGSLIRVYPGVYRVGHAAPSLEADYAAAIVACGEGAVLSGRAAAQLLGLLHATERRITGIATRRARRGTGPNAMTWKGISVTTPARTLVDLAAVVYAGELARAVHEAGIRHGTTPSDIEAVLAQRPTSPGAGRPREVIHGDQGSLLSQL